jgi:hypothetical protein
MIVDESTIDHAIRPGNFEIPSQWQSGLTSAAVVGQIIGLFMNGFLADRFGYRWTILVDCHWDGISKFPGRDGSGAPYFCLKPGKVKKLTRSGCL